MSDYDEYEDHFRPTPECHECECGHELTISDSPELCDCGQMRCSECTHACEWCGHEGCESCMTHTEDGWCHTDECAARNTAAEDRRDAEADVHYMRRTG